ncbi:phosphocarrier protein HPr /dihydroxyacetone kinase DhaM subunit [Halopolyspora algeriensis]|uniref:Phosphocarrier protein HPr n=1 Tax=Halopolyspora algeriensis TaxID=1500506 RepID=A0A368VTR9_9ACTN|nr:dihydroxyacetone kinase phosphoryl donor subunit DhaM [Halopolyspora algeriensis]RCW45211.1 phosphocarrier protein HPr /dihydroxyacetone kinase DhaM subunit [Halopolyspora algeriensis]TQM53070.1 phosphocarrier protein HPr /dihydroxyacetone kinase DhaM subunit [Halopolyspora algeriensis]
MSVGLVIVAHSGRLAEGVVELAAQMAPEVRVVPAGGLPDGATGTDFETVSAALSDADSGSGAVLLYDLGSAQMTAELAVESLGDPSTAIVADAPLVEGAVAAAVAAQGDSDVEAVARAAAGAASMEMAGAEPGSAAGAEPAPGQPAAAGESATAAAEIREELVLDNEIGLHARPAAMLTRTLTGLDATVTIVFGDKEADAASVLGLMGLGARQGDRITIRASGRDAQQAVQRILDLAARDFDE